MYPVVRMLKELAINRNAPPLGLTGTHVSRHICWPHDIDMFLELNNGRTMTLYDMGRLVLARRTGLIGVLRANRWGMTVAGSSVRYRRRVRMFDRFDMESRCTGWDARFLYVEQSMWRRGECTSHALLRLAVTDRAGIVPTARVLEALGASPVSPDLPDWIAAWIIADGGRPWPPMRDDPGERTAGLRSGADG